MRQQGSIREQLKLAFCFAVAAASLVLLFWLQKILLLTFLALVLAVLLDAMAQAGTRFLKLPRAVAVVMAALLFLVGIGGALALLSVPLIREGTALWQSMPQKLSKAQARLSALEKDAPWLGQFLPNLEKSAEQSEKPEPKAAARKAFATVSRSLQFGADALATFFLAVFFAWNPPRWQRGMAELLPAQDVDESICLFQRVGQALRSYLFTYAVYILAMGSLWAIGLWLIGIDYFIVFGVIGGLVELAPYIGPMVGLVPPLLIALATAPAKAAWVLLLYLILHIIEGYLLVPLLMHEREHLPPPIIILSLLICGTLFGTMGVLLSVPLGTVVYVLVNELVYNRKPKARAHST